MVKDKVECLLEQILDQLKKPAEIGLPVRKEWFPLFFHLYARGSYVHDTNFGSSKWGFKKIEPNDLKLDFDYEFDSLKLHTEYGTYKPALRMMINGQRYPQDQRLCSEYTTYTGWKRYTGHNYNYQRCYMFWNVFDTSQVMHATYPFKMIVRKPWSLNFEFFQTTTSYQWHTVEIMGWKLFYDTADVVKELENVVKS